MFEKLRVVFTIPELRQKILITLLFLGVYRVGWQIPLPIIDQEVLSAQSGEQQGGFSKFINQVAIFSASNLQQATIFGLGIMPYISASIIFQLLGSVWKPIEDLRKEGETGRKKINEYTRYLTVLLCVVQSFMYVQWYLMATPVDGANLIATPFESTGSDGVARLMLGWQLVAVTTMTCGTIFLMWLGEQIDEFGIGNGISLLIMAGILARMPAALLGLLSNADFELVGLGNGQVGVETLLVLSVMFIGVIFGVVFITLGQRRIPTQSAKHVRGRRVYGGTRQYLPLRINQAGVMPIIFASSLLMIPQMVLSFAANYVSSLSYVADMFGRGDSFLYNAFYVVLIYFFCYFWTAITFNPKEMADNLKDNGTFIPGYRPGKRTADYLEKVMVRITYVGAGFLAIVAIVPTIVSSSMQVDPQIASFYGGTGLLIAVSVAFDLVQKIDSHLVMRNYRGLLEG
ncbi:preprotein translocase subunit SecY [Lignipirellula cremea]|uniref:Protein translocase subunit SecY n=1 Tax=Lignipirellula cremea TaxID=2528010 RepID=A0A518DMZ2_9BACT|nr:preprotein translocase subunit SecY [Lignipirellula cremea]QDU93191.1 Protein translocase subunit SecY [Lignipirellula cremea]